MDQGEVVNTIVNGGSADGGMGFSDGDAKGQPYGDAELTLLGGSGGWGDSEPVELVVPLN